MLSWVQAQSPAAGLAVVLAAPAQLRLPFWQTLVKSKPAAPPPTLAGNTPVAWAASRPKRPSCRGLAAASPVLAASQLTMAVPMLHWVWPVSLSRPVGPAAWAGSAHSAQGVDHEGYSRHSKPPGAQGPRAVDRG
jgi:hypothetical protein